MDGNYNHSAPHRMRADGQSERLFTSTEVADAMHKAEMEQIDRQLRDESRLHREAEMNQETERGLIAANAALGRTVADMQVQAREDRVTIDNLRSILQSKHVRLRAIGEQLARRTYEAEGNLGLYETAKHLIEIRDKELEEVKAHRDRLIAMIQAPIPKIAKRKPAKRKR